MTIIKIKKGLDLPVSGAAQKTVAETPYISTFAVKPTDYVGLTPKLLVAEGDAVAAGEPLLCDKNRPQILFPSPVSGTVKEIVRGEKRLLEAVVVEKQEGWRAEPAEGWQTPGTREELVPQMLQSGMWTLLRQRPFGIIPSPESKPKAIFVSGFDSAPLGMDYDFALQGRDADLAAGVKGLQTLGGCPVHLSFRPGQRLASLAEGWRSQQVEVHYFDGPHPAGNIGTQIAHVSPLNKGEQVWCIELQDLAIMGRWLRTGAADFRKVAAVAGPNIKNPQHYRITAGACVSQIVADQLLHTDYPQIVSDMEKSRIISGNMLCGTQIASDGFMGAHDSLLTILPEGDYYDFMGWLMPGLQKYSFSRTFWSGFVPRWLHCIYKDVPPFMSPKFDTNRHGDVRPLVFTGSFERVFPFDIYPTQLIKACLIGDIELQERLGIYEVEPEDFALCEYIDTSKTDIQPIIREALETLRKEAL